MIPILIPIPMYSKSFDSDSDFDSSIMPFQFRIQCLANSMITILIPTNQALIPILIPESDYDIIYNSEMYGIECITKVIDWDLEYVVAFF